MDNALKHRHENDAVSVERLVSELQKEDNLVTGEESFLLVIMTTFLSHMFMKHSGRIVGVDSTHNTNPSL